MLSFDRVFQSYMTTPGNKAIDQNKIDFAAVILLIPELASIDLTDLSNTLRNTRKVKHQVGNSVLETDIAQRLPCGLTSIDYINACIQSFSV